MGSLNFTSVISIKYHFQTVLILPFTLRNFQEMHRKEELLHDIPLLFSFPLVIAVITQ